MNELTVLGLWRSAFALARRHAAFFAAIMAITTVLPALFVAFSFAAVYQQIAVAAPGGAQPDLPPAFLLAALLVMLAQFLGYFMIVAVAADPDEGRDQAPLALAARALKALGKTLLAYLLFNLVTIAAGVVMGLGLALIILVGGWAIGSENLAASFGDGQAFATAATVFVVLAVILAVVWGLVRLTPLPGVYAHEDTGVITGIKRAWRLSVGWAWTLFFSYLLALVALLPLLLVQLSASGSATDGIASGLRQVLLTLVGSILAACFASWSGLAYRRLADRQAGAD